MKTLTSQDLLRAYVTDGSEAAFRDLVSRYVNLVYSVALRRVAGQTGLAEDVTQQVFSDLAAKAASLPSSIQLGGWLHRHTCFVSANVLRSEQRRQARELVALQMNALHHGSADWKELAPILDEAIDQLPEVDRAAVLLRFYEQLDLRRVGETLGVSDDAAQKRVSRALETLRDWLTARGMMLSVATLASLLAAAAVCAAPVSFAAAVNRRVLARKAASAGVAAFLVAWLGTLGGKAVVGAVVLGAVVALVSRSPREMPLPAGAPPTLGPALSVAEPTPAEPAASPDTSLTAVEVAEVPAGGLRLTILATDSGRPIPNARIEYRGWEGRQFKGRKFEANREGVCQIAFDREKTTQFELTTRVDGFADTRLHWRPDRGEQIPESYTMRVGRPVRLSGRVVDADGQSVAGAKVGFNHEADPATESRPEDHQFSWIEAVTDADGRWEIDRVAPEMVRRIYGSARHAEYVNSPMIHVVQDPNAEAQLRQGTHVFRLGRPISIRGLVVDPDGDPVPEAKILVGTRGESGRREAVTLVDGTFTVAGCKPGRNLVTAEADGFAPLTVEINAAADSAPVRLALEPSKILRLRMVSQEGQPVPKAFVWFNDRSRGPMSTNRPPPTQASFSPRSDADGRVVWSNAPDRELTFDVQAPGYMRVNDLIVRPDGQEHLITVPPALVVAGTVCDAESGASIPRFRIVCGWPDISGEPRWSTLDRFWLSFAGGRFKHSFDEGVVGSRSNPGYVLKFEAEGYAAGVSRVIAANEGEVRLDMTLHTATTASIPVWLPDDRPATQAEVGLVSRGAALVMGPNGFSRQVPNTGALLWVDATGRFSLPADETISRVLVVHRDGFASVTPAALKAAPEVRLQRWGRLEGTYITNGQPVVGAPIRLDLVDGDYSTVSLDRSGFRVETDAAGKFRFPKVPPGPLRITHLLRQEMGEQISEAHRPLTQVEVKAGATTTVVLGGERRRFKLHFRWPEELVREANSSLHVSLQSPLRSFGALASNAPELFVDARRTTGAMRTHVLFEQADQTWATEEVPAGNYALHARLFRPAAGGRYGELQAVGEIYLSLPDQPSSEPIELEVPLVKPAPANGSGPRP